MTSLTKCIWCVLRSYYSSNSSREALVPVQPVPNDY